MTHDLKTWPKEFEAVASGQKRHEVRRNDRKFQSGDEVVLQEFRTYDAVGVAPGLRTSGYTGRKLTFTIGHVTTGPSWGLPDDMCVFTLLDREKA